MGGPTLRVGPTSGNGVDPDPHEDLVAGDRDVDLAGAQPRCDKFQVGVLGVLPIFVAGPAAIRLARIEEVRQPRVYREEAGDHLPPDVPLSLPHVPSLARASERAIPGVPARVST